MDDQRVGPETHNVGENSYFEIICRKNNLINYTLIRFVNHLDLIVFIEKIRKH